MIRYQLAPIALIAMLLLIGTTASAEKIIYYTINTKPNEVAVRTAAIDRFEAKHPGVEVEYLRTASSGGYGGKLITMLMSSDPPDIIETNIGAPILDWIRNDIVIDLSSYLEKDKGFWNAFQPAIRDLCTVFGAVYQIPVTELANYVIWFNATTFDDYGLLYPKMDWTHDDFLAIGKKLTRDRDGDGSPDHFAYSYYSWQAWLPWFVNRGGQFVDSEYRQQLLTDPKTVNALEWIISLEHEHNIVPRNGQIPDRNRGGYVNGDFAMVQAGTWMYASYNLGEMMPNVMHGVVLEPSGPAGRNFMMTVQTASITRVSKHPDLAWEFLKELASEKTLADLAIRNSGVPVRQDAMWAFLEQEPPAPIINWYDTFVSYGTYPMFPAAWLPSQVNVPLGPVFSGEKPVGPYLTSLAPTVQAQLDEFWQD